MAWFFRRSHAAPENGAGHSALPSTAPTRSDFQTGQVLRSSSTDNAYDVLDVKHGGFGAVYIVRGHNSGTRHALKTFQARFLRSDMDVARFEREALTWLLLDRHPNVVTAHTVERIEGFPCIVLEYVPGGDLASRLTRGPLAVAHAILLALQFCDGMAFAHDKLGLVHRDIKPANCLLDEAGTLKVTDFGLARAFGPNDITPEGDRRPQGPQGPGGPGDAGHTTVAGTPPYMAPEQFDPHAQLDTRTDIYAFGVMLHQLLTGELNRDGREAQRQIRASARAQELPLALHQLILRSVDPLTSKRPENFHVVRDALAQSLQDFARTDAPRPAGPSPLSAADWNNKAIALTALGYQSEALTCFEHGLAIEAEHVQLWVGKSATLAALNRHEDALACADHGLCLDPGNGVLFLNRGKILSDLGRLDEAITCFDRAAQLTPQSGAVWGNRAAALWQLGRHAEALEAWEQGLRVEPRNAVLWTNSGTAFSVLGRHAEALTCFDRALAIAARDGATWLKKGTLLHELGRHAEAMPCLESATQLIPDSLKPWHRRGTALVALGDHAGAMACFERGLTLTPEDPGLLRSKGLALGASGRYREALACFERGLRVDPTHAGLWHGSGLALRSLGNRREADVRFQRAREFTPVGDGPHEAEHR